MLKHRKLVEEQLLFPHQVFSQSCQLWEHSGNNVAVQKKDNRWQYIYVPSMPLCTCHLSFRMVKTYIDIYKNGHSPKGNGSGSWEYDKPPNWAEFRGVCVRVGGSVDSRAETLFSPLTVKLISVSKDGYCFGPSTFLVRAQGSARTKNVTLVLFPSE